MSKWLKSIKIDFKDGPTNPSMVAVWLEDGDNGRSQKTSRVEGADLQRVLGLAVEEIADPTDPIGSVLTHMAAILDEGEPTRKAMRFNLRVIDATTAEPISASLTIRNLTTDQVLFSGPVPAPEAGEDFAHIDTPMAVQTEVVVSADGYFPMTLTPKISRGGRILTVRLNPT